MVVAEYFKRHGVPDAEPTYGSEPGRDVKNVPGVAIEVKARREFSPLEWARQAESNADGDLPVSIVRCNGQGEKSVDEWLAFVRVKDLVRLLQSPPYW